MNTVTNCAITAAGAKPPNEHTVKAIEALASAIKANASAVEACARALQSSGGNIQTGIVMGDKQ